MFTKIEKELLKDFAGATIIRRLYRKLNGKCTYSIDFIYENIPYSIICDLNK